MSAGIEQSKPTLTLQINTTGAWRSVVSFEASRRREVARAIRHLARVLDPSPKWCFLSADGRREWLDQP